MCARPISDIAHFCGEAASFATFPRPRGRLAIGSKRVFSHLEGGGGGVVFRRSNRRDALGAVSYTHLTLPTILLV
eukprot:2086715-Pyramimonas_sp.AAC.1